MGALTIASVSTFTSCKDYDDDIDNLQNQIKDLASADQLQQKVTELQGLITTNSTNIKDVQEAVKKAQAAAETAQTTATQKATLEDLKKLLAEGDYASKEYVDKADGIIDAALKALETGKVDQLAEAVKKAQAAAEAAQTAADNAIKEAGKDGQAFKEAQAAATAAQEAKDALAKLQNSIGGGYSETTTVKDAITSIDILLKADNTGLDALNTRLKVIEDALQSGDDTTGLATRLENIESALKNIIGQFSTMVTDVQLFNIAQPNYTGFNRTLDFVQAAEQANVFPAEANVADKQLTFEKGKYYSGEDSLLIRVSPVDAELTPGSISLLNSQGKELDDIIDVKEVHRYKELLYGYTRAGGVNSGLWVVKFKAKDLGDNFKAAAETEVNDQPRSILYAVAVKNTYNTTDKAEEASTRRVTSEYGIDLNTTPAEPAWDFTVNEKPVRWIHNRYVATEESFKYTDQATGYYAKTYAQELTWLDNNKPATKVILTGDDQNAEDRTGHTTGDWNDGVDNRQQYPILAVEMGKPITIDFGNTGEKGIKGFYVTLDEKFAQESAPTELNAWNSYTFENVGYKNQPAKLFEGSKGTITIKDMNNVKGDVIGFRVHAVNYDGTLTDPDGRSFYVAVGDVKTTKNLGNSDLTWNETSKKFESTVVLPADFSSYDFDGYESWRIVGADESGNTPDWDDFSVKYYAADGSEVSSLNNTVKSVKFILNEPRAFIDGATYNVTMTLTKQISSATAKVCTINASFTKKMPTDAPTFTYRDGFTKNPEYIIPAGGNYSVLASGNKGGTFDLRNILIINNNTTWNGVDLFDDASAGLFTFNVAGGTYTNGNLDKAEATGSRYIMAVNNSGEQNLVDNSTERTIKAYYTYKNISKRNENGSWITGNYSVPSTSSEKIVYCSWMNTFELDVNKTDMKWSDNNKVTWKANPDANGTKLFFNKLAVKVKDINLLPVKTGVKGSTMDTFFANNTLAVVKGKYGKIWTTSTDGKQINPYFSAEIDATGITLKQNSQSAIPSGVTGGKIKFTVKDCFGNVKPISLDFQILSNGVDAARKH
ncbi:hypothetical protein V7U47_06120 [Segatella copri]|uniref:hypothetical protein n=1 Tax=Segatella copri TaxID=165179 RepID=UPI002FF290DB